MPIKSAITYVLTAATALVVFTALVFNRELLTSVESNTTLASTERLSLVVENFSTGLDSMGVNEAIDQTRLLWKRFLGMETE